VKNIQKVDFAVAPSSGGVNSSPLHDSQGVDELATLDRYHHFHGELELGLIQTQMAQKPMLRAEVYAHAMRASQNRKKEVRRKSSYVLTSESGGRAMATLPVCLISLSFWYSLP